MAYLFTKIFPTACLLSLFHQKFMNEKKIIYYFKSAKHHKDARHQLWHRKKYTYITIFSNYRKLNIIYLNQFANLWVKMFNKLTTNFFILNSINFKILVKLKKHYQLISTLLFMYILLHIFYSLTTLKYFIVFWLILLGMFMQIMIFTACERKMLALIQRRTGPAVVGTRGRLQCIADSLKLLTKVFVSARKINSTMFQIAAFGGFWVSWYNFGNLTYGPGLDIMEVEYNIFFMLSISVIFSIMWLLAGWSATSKYSMLGCFRAAIQFLSFEILMSTILLIVFTIFNCFNFELMVVMQKNCPLAICMPTLAIITLFTFFMETNRPPFDLSEAESDIVAGYNVEYSGILFGLFYLGEYLNLFAACTMLILIFCGGWLNPLLFFQTIVKIIYIYL